MMHYFLAQLAHPEWANQTTLHPLGLVAVVVLGLVMLVVPRRHAVLPMIVMACFVSSAQRLVLVGLDFNLLRLMLLFGWLRILLRGENRGFNFRPLDLTIIAWLFCGTAIYTILHGTLDAFINRLGSVYDAAGMYFLFRCLIRTWSDVEDIIIGFAWVSIPLAGAFVLEHLTGRNAFAIFGGVLEITVIRDGRLRCQGAFSHPILAGCFWASLIPLFAGLWWRGGQSRTWSVVGLSAALIIVLMCASATPLIAVALALVAAAFFPLRKWMAFVRWGILGSLVGLHLLMNNPVWHLISRITVVGGNTGWHRYYLIDQAINRVGEWGFLGTKSTAHWGWGLDDITNQFVLVGVRGGLLTLILFVAVIALSFGAVGRLLAQSAPDRFRTVFTWAIGASLFVHCVNYVGVSYFGQIIIVWYMLLAIIGSLDAAHAYRQVVVSPIVGYGGVGSHRPATGSA